MSGKTERYFVKNKYILEAALTKIDNKLPMTQYGWNTLHRKKKNNCKCQ